MKFKRPRPSKCTNSSGENYVVNIYLTFSRDTSEFYYTWYSRYDCVKIGKSKSLFQFPHLSVHLLVCHTSVSHHNYHYQCSFQVLSSFPGEALPLWTLSIFTCQVFKKGSQTFLRITFLIHWI